MKEGGYLVHFFKRIEHRRGRQTAIIATANKLSKIIWNMLTKKEAYHPVLPVEYLNKIRKKEVRNIQRRIRQFDIKEEELTFALA